MPDSWEEEIERRTVGKAGRRARRKAVATRDGVDGESGSMASYPYDLFEVISDYLHPESVSAFSLVCRSAHAAVSRAGFWRRLYADLYREWRAPAAMPEELRPWNVDRRGVRLK